MYQSQFIEMFGCPFDDNRNWQSQKLCNLGVLARGVSKARPRNSPDLIGGPYPLVQTGEVANCETYITSHESSYSEKGLAQSKMWPAGTLCITIAANIAKTGILTFDACFPDSVVGFIPNKDINILFIHHWFCSIQKELERQAPSTAQKNFNLEKLSNLQINVPPMNLQVRFADIVIQADKSKFVDCKSQFIEMFGNHSWETAYLEDVVSEECSLSYGIVQPGEGFDKGVPVVRPVDLVDDIVEPDNLKKTTIEIANSYKRTTLKGGELLLCVRGTTGIVSKASNRLNGGNVTRGIVPIWFKDNISDPFMFYLMRSDYVQSQIKEKTYGTTLLQINIKDLRKIKVILPPDELQLKFISIAQQADKSKYFNYKS